MIGKDISPPQNSRRDRIDKTTESHWPGLCLGRARFSYIDMTSFFIIYHNRPKGLVQRKRERWFP